MVQAESVQLTVQGRMKLDEELRLLREERQPALSERIFEANEHGDVSDNSEFDELKNELAMLEARAMELEHILSRAQIIDPGSGDGMVRLGSTVRIRDDEGEEETWQVVSPEEADSMAGSISTESPVGEALVGCREGQSLTVSTPAGQIVYTVLGVT
jgi:transcription elongation factor GreA